MATHDIILDSNGSFIAKDGDFLQGDNTNNLMYYNIISSVGHFRSAPLLGVGITNYLNQDILPTVIERNIKSSLANDVFPKANVDASNFPEIIINKEIIINVNGND
jgi:hypothetical protein